MTTTETRGVPAESIAVPGAEVDVVIVNYRSAPQLFNCLESVHRVAREDGVAVEVTVVNNGDTADIPGVVRDAGGGRLVENGGNIGYGGACNLGARAGRAPVIFFLNPDTVLAAGCLRRCAGFLGEPANSAAGIVGPELSDEAGRLVRSSSKLPSTWDLLGRSLGIHVLFPKSDYPFLPLAMHRTSGFVGQLMGAALMIRRPLFEALGGFDERFFLYYEDVDLCARARDRGARCFYLNTARATHIGRVSSSQDEGMALALYLRSGLTYARLHHGAAAEAQLALSCFTVEFLLRLLQAIPRRRLSGVVRAYRLLLRNLVYRESIVAQARG